MRLLHLVTLELEEFQHDNIPKYAILSHRWGKDQDEVSLEDMRTGEAQNKKGYSKIKNFGDLAAAQRLKYIWVDTCCIDKGSSAELSEAINSMYRWYRCAAVCFVYMVDVSVDEKDRLDEVSFRDSKWFTRGWTLQELIAPERVEFYSADWNFLGTKTSLQELIMSITGINLEILESAEELGSVSISQRMSWAAKREIIRVEDLAYCLIGIFDVRMPLLYGEGEKAFIRFQEEIMKSLDDHTFFAWQDKDAAESSCTGLLASSPAQFQFSSDMKPFTDWNTSLPYSLTNKGLSISLILIPCEDDSDISLATLDCQFDEDFTCRPAIYLKCISATGNQYARVKTSRIASLDPGLISKGELKTIYIRQKTVLPASQNDGLSRFWIKISGEQFSFIISEVCPSERWDIKTRTLQLPSRGYGAMGAIRFERSKLNSDKKRGTALTLLHTPGRIGQQIAGIVRNLAI